MCFHGGYSLSKASIWREAVGSGVINRGFARLEWWTTHDFVPVAIGYRGSLKSITDVGGRSREVVSGTLARDEIPASRACDFGHGGGTIIRSIGLRE